MKRPSRPNFGDMADALRPLYNRLSIVGIPLRHGQMRTPPTQTKLVKDRQPLRLPFLRARNPLKRLEQTLEQAIEAPIGRVFRHGLQPAEIGRRLEREMRAGRVYSVEGAIVPNDFRVYLNPKDQETLSPYLPDVTDHLAGWLKDIASSEGLMMLGPVTIQVDVTDKLGPGAFDASAAIKRGNAPPNHVAPSRIDQTIPYQPTVLAPAGTTYTLNLVGGPIHGAAFAVPNGITTLGRSRDNDIVIEAIQVSRYHARFESFDDIVRLVDLGSTNGTFVNGKPIADWVVVGPGDRLMFGNQNATLTDGHQSGATPR